MTGYEGADVLDVNRAEFANDSAVTSASEGRWAFDWGNRLVGATLTKDFGTLTLEQRASASGFAMELDLADGARAQRSTIRDLRVAGSLLARGVAHDRSIGYELAAHRARYAVTSSQTGTTDLDLVQRPGSGVLWVDDLWRVAPKWIVPK